MESAVTDTRVYSSLSLLITVYYSCIGGIKKESTTDNFYLFQSAYIYVNICTENTPKRNLL